MLSPCTLSHVTGVAPAAVAPHLTATGSADEQAGGDAQGVEAEGEYRAEWSEEEIVFLHWRLLQEVRQLSDPETPLEEKYDTLRWVFTERDKDDKPFSFVNCLRVVGCSPLSPIGYCGLVDAEEVRDQIRHSVRAWLIETTRRYPEWVRDAIATNPAWVEVHLAKNPQWINEQLKRMSTDGDLFA